MVQIDAYKIKIEGLEIEASIEKEKYKLMYNLNIPPVSDTTSLILNEIKKKLILEVILDPLENTDPRIIKKIKEKFRNSANNIINSFMPGLNEETKNFIIGFLIRDMLGLGDIEILLEDINLEEVVINSATEPIRIYHKKYGWLETNITIKDEAQIQNFANIIARRVGRQITTLNPLLDAHLITGDRSNAVLYPISHKGNTITIRKFARDPWTVTDLIKNNTCPAEIFALIWLSIQYEMNILISGGTASGKTSFLNVILPFIPPNHRIISIEDTLELQLPKFLYWAPLTVRQPNPEGKGGVDMLDLLVNSLRMRPDRIILGEIRKSAQAEVLFEAMHTGHSVYATVHADSMSETIRRLINPPINVPSNLLTAVNLNVVMFRDRRRGIRRVSQIGEFIVSEESGRTTVKPNLLYRWDPNKDKIVEHSASVKLYDKLSTHTGMSYNEIQKDLKEKQDILNWLVKNDVRDIYNVGKSIADYYLDKESILKRIKGKPDFNIKNNQVAKAVVKKTPHLIKVKKIKTKSKDKKKQLIKKSKKR